MGLLAENQSIISLIASKTNFNLATTTLNPPVLAKLNTSIQPELHFYYRH